MHDHPKSSDTCPPRAFAQGTGVVMQTVGAILFFSSCCVCSAAFLWDSNWTRHQAQRAAEQNEPLPTSTIEHLLSEPAKLGMMMMVIIAPVGGLALMVFGLGLQSDKLRSGWYALIANVALLLLLIAAGVALWSGGASIPSRIWHAIVTLVVLLLTGFTVAALRDMLANPPSGELNVVPHDYDPKKDINSH